jgi:5-methylthioadenosine/S-adenosylhomocysteine deaminase
MPNLYLTNANIAVSPEIHPSGWLQDACLLVEDGRISAISPVPLPAEKIASAETLSLHNRAVTPVWVNGHTHLSQTFMRGLAGGRPLLRWLKERIWPLQDALTPETLELAALLGLAENIRSAAGVVVDHQKITLTPAHSEAVFRAAQQSGLRVWLARAWSDRGAAAESPARILEEMEEFMQRNGYSARVKFANGPLAAWRCSAETLCASHQLARQYGAFTHIHVSETEDEVQLSLDEYHIQPIEWLAHIGVLDEATHIVHAVWAEEREVALLAERGAVVVHCPVSNAVLGSGIAPLARMMESGVHVRLGTDGPASNDTQDTLETMKFALCLARAHQRNAALIPPRAALQMAWDSPGLKVGQPADFAVLRLDGVWSAPVQDLDSALALCLRVADVESLAIGGQFILRENRLLTIDETAVLRESQKAVVWLRQKAGLEV